MSELSSNMPTVLADGAYRLHRVLGEGGMGVVVLGESLSDGRQVAIKLVRTGLLGSPRSIKRFELEARNTASLDHPNIVKVLDYGRDQDLLYLAMEYIPGHNLQDHLDHSGQMGWRRLVGVLRQVLLGLEAAHESERRIIHRDIKPANILLVDTAASDDVRLVDFGVARAMSGSVVGTVGILGSPHTMAPEQWNSDPIGPPTDFYGLGCTAHWMLAGQPPFKAPNALALGAKHTLAPPPDLEPLCEPGTPKALLRWVKWLMRKAPESRPQTAREALAFLERAVEHGALSLPTFHTEPVSTSPTDWIRALEVGRSSTVSLPHFDARFVGRISELDVLEQRISMGASLVTITGVAGSGKSRLAIEWARRAMGRFPAGVFFCDLSTARSLHTVCVLLAQELNVQLKADEPVAQLGQALRRLGRVLVVFDNVEPMVELADVTVGVWLREATEALFVVTSRQSLGLGSECLLELTPFTPPIPQSLTLRTIEASTEASWSLDLLRANDAVVLFVESARLVKPDFELTDANAVDIAKLVGQLDGLPLAIELAAARIRSMSPATILARLGQRFRLLRSNRRDISPRQMTLKAALDGSWELMEPIERIFLIQCAVFEGSFNLEAAETILDLSIHEDSPWVIDLVDALVHKSLLRTVQGRSELRYSMYASVRDYAHTRLQAEPELQASLGGGGLDLLRGRHLNYFSRYGSPMSIRRLDQGRSPVEELGRELDNIAAALRWALTDGRWAEATRCAQALSAYFLRQGPARAGLEVIDHLVESSPDNLPPHGALLGLKLVRGRLALAVGRLEEAEDAAQQVLANVPPGSVWRIQAMHLQAILLEHGGHLDNAISLYTSAVALAQQLGDTTFEAKMLAELVASLRLRGRFDEAVATGEHAVRLLRRLRLVRHEGSARILLANTLSQLGRLDEAEPHYIRALEVLRATGDRRLEGWCLMNLGLLSRSRDQAIACFQASLTLADRFGDPRLQSYVLQNLAYTLADLPEHLPESLSYARRAAVLAQEVGERRAEAWTLLTLASALTYAERFEEAQTRIDEAALLGESIPEPALHREIHIVRALLARALGDVPGVQAMLGPLRHILDHNEHDDDPPARVEVNALQAWVWIQQGLHDDASALLKASRHLDPNLDRMPYLRPLRLLTEVAAMLA